MVDGISNYNFLDYYIFFYKQTEQSIKRAPRKGGIPYVYTKYAQKTKERKTKR